MNYLRRQKTVVSLFHNALFCRSVFNTLDIIPLAYTTYTSSIYTTLRYRVSRTCPRLVNVTHLLALQHRGICLTYIQDSREMDFCETTRHNKLLSGNLGNVFGGYITCSQHNIWIYDHNQFYICMFPGKFIWVQRFYICTLEMQTITLFICFPYLAVKHRFYST